MSTAENYGSYQLLKRLATGGMAQIFLARQKGPEGFEKLLVVKRILPHLAENDEFVRMFLDEARIAARLNHPNIVQIFNLGAQDDTYFIAMEYIHGEDVRRVWRHAEHRGKSMPLQLVCRVIVDACAGLDYAHKKDDQNGKPLGIVHRDISPQNILVTFEGGVKVVDFGIAKAADQATVTKSGVLKGKYSYMSPEQASGKKVDRRSDIFALGIVLHELLTGHRLFKRANEIQTLHAVIECEVVPPSKVNPKIPAELDAVVMKALAKNPEHRYQAAIELQMALEKWLLERQLPSSSVQLAAFMSDLYADRLAEEKRTGQLLIDEVGHARRLTDEEIQAPQTPASKSSRGSSIDGRLPPPKERLRERGGLAQPPRAPELTPSAMTPSASSQKQGIVREGIFQELIKNASLLQGLSDRQAISFDQPMTEPLPDGGDTISQNSMQQSGTAATAITASTTNSDGSRAEDSRTSLPAKRRFPIPPIPLLVSVLALMGVGAVSYYLATRGPVAPLPLATVRVRSNPPGATVLFADRPLGELTPCTLPAMPAGTYSLRLGKPGYVDHASSVTIPEQGVLELPSIDLVPETRRPGAQAAASLPPASEQKLVEVTFESEPSSNLTIDGAVQGRTPVTVKLRSGVEVQIHLDRTGYQSVARTVSIGEGPKVERVELAKIGPPRPAIVHPKNGKVRFAVTPWANVSCGAYEIGQTPVPDRDLPVGVYECKFSNPEFVTQTKIVEVRANEVSKVSVKF